MNNHIAGVSPAFSQNSRPIFFSKQFLKKAPAFLLLACLPLAVGTAQGATVTVSSRTNLQTAVNAAANDGEVVFASNVPGVEINNDLSSNPGLANAIHTSSPSPITIRGRIPSNFSANVGTLTTALLANANKTKASPTATIAQYLANRVSTFVSGLPTGLTYIVGDDQTLIRTRSSANVNDFNVAKWLNLEAGASGLGLENLHFKDVTVDYTFTYNPALPATGAGGVTNGLIGNYSGNTHDIRMGNLIGNEFSNIDITLHGYRDTHYLAGGGLIGLRATGEGGAASASASMGSISGNVFRDVNITTDEAAASPNKGQSAYIEGGGIIGVDAVSSPAPTDGHASIDALTNNLFTGIRVRSDDVLLGGGVVGLNNNSQNYNANTYTRLIRADGNIFGNGTTGDIAVQTYYSLRGGGVIGLNGLSNSAVALDFLTNNSFAGITVNVSNSYLKGGGIVGLQSNDGYTDKYPLGPALGLVSTHLGTANNNLFLNEQVSVGTYLEGGGILGLRAGKGMAELDALTNNIFKGLDVRTGGYLYGGGIVGLSSQNWATLLNAAKNYFDDLTVTVAEALRGGGVIGVSANGENTAGGEAATLGYVTGNVFNNLRTAVTGDLAGGGIVGAYATNGSTAAFEISGNTFSALTVTPSSLLSGGGVIGFQAATGNVVAAGISGNTFRGLTVTPSGLLSGGGVIGLNADQGGAHILAFESNAFSGVTINAGGSIQGGGILGLRSDADQALVSSLTSNAFNGLTVTAQNGDISGGGVIGVHSDNGEAVADRIAGNTLESASITAGDDLSGGGLIGVNASAGNASLGRLSNTSARGVSVTVGNSLTGGGIVGLASPKGISTMENINNNTFGGAGAANIVRAGSLTGGGIIGVAARNEANPYSLASLIDNSFGDESIAVTGNIQGGGVVGVSVNTGAASIGEIIRNVFTRQTVDAGGIAGGGIVGLQGNDRAWLAWMDNNSFLESAVSTQGALTGGGIVGLSAAGGSAQLTGMEGNQFSGLTVATKSSQENLRGGGVVGVFSNDGQAVLGITKDNSFDRINVSSAAGAQGGGIVGVYTGKSDVSSINNLSGNNFLRTTINISGDMAGGGIVGGYSRQGLATAGTIADNIFMGTTPGSFSVKAKTLTGGGVIGFASVDGSAMIESVSGNTFYNLDIEATDHIQGGGVLGVSSSANGAAVILNISQNIFDSLRIKGGKYIDGGGVIGATGTSANIQGGDDPVAGIPMIDGSMFLNNTVTAEDLIMGGLVYSYGFAGEGNIRDSWFQNNFTSATGADGKVYGTVTVDTGNGISPIQTLTLTGTDGNSTTFYGNTIADKDGARANSLYFGTVANADPLVDPIDPANSDARLIVDAQAGGIVALFDPILVDQSNGNTLFPDYTHTFNMQVLGNGGEFIWGGNNVFLVGDDSARETKNTVEFLPGSVTTLDRGMTLTAAEHDVVLAQGGRINVLGWNYANPSPSLSGNVMTVASSALNGELYFVLNTQDVNNSDRPLLTINLPDSNPHVDIDGATITLSHFAAGQRLQAGDRFYLIDTVIPGYLDPFDGKENNPANHYATARQGLFLRYTFIIDKEQAEGEDPNNRYLVARLAADVPAGEEVPPSSGGDVPGGNVPSPVVPGGDVPSPTVPSGDVPSPTVPSYVPSAESPGGYVPPPSGNTPSGYTPSVGVPGELIPETRILSEGRIAGLAFLSRIGGWLADHSYQQADLALREDGWTTFGGVDEAWFRADSGSHIDVSGTNLLAGIATRRSDASATYLLGAFFQGGYADYKINGDFGTNNKHVSGGGNIRYYGGGLMGRVRGNNGLRVEGSLRAGQVENDFHSRSIKDERGRSARYDISVPYLGAHAGLGYETRIDERHSLDFLARYYWTSQGSASETMHTGEKVHFETDNSHLVRAGARYTYSKDQRNFWYAGAAYEYEFDGRVHATAHGMKIATPSLRGGGGVGDIGVIIRPKENNRFTLEAGVQGYVGIVEGLSAGIRLGWEF
jgi:hypothetical protein